MIVIPENTREKLTECHLRMVDFLKSPDATFEELAIRHDKMTKEILLSLAQYAKEFT